VRELANVVARALILSPGPMLQVEEMLDAVGPRRPDRLDEVEREHILHMLKRCEWRVDGAGKAAATLGLNPSTLRSRMQKLGIARPARRAGARADAGTSGRGHHARGTRVRPTCRVGVLPCVEFLLLHDGAVTAEPTPRSTGLNVAKQSPSSRTVATAATQPPACEAQISPRL